MSIASANQSMNVVWNMPRSAQTHRHAIVLAGGDGTRMRPLIKNWLGEDRPKQYCTFVGSRSMLRHTLDRAATLVGKENTMAIIGRHHVNYFRECAGGPLERNVIVQPKNHGTAAGLLLPAAYLSIRDPMATVMVLPSDHYIYPEDRFLDLMHQTFSSAERYPDRVFILGAQPDSPETDYGWITPGTALSRDRETETAHTAKVVSGFHEKPTAEKAQSLVRSGAVWNTMVMVAKVQTLWVLGWRYLPHMMTHFEAFREVLRARRDGRVGKAEEARALSQLYEHLRPADFSREVLQRSVNRSAVIPMRAVEWSDWGRPERVQETLARLGKEPIFRLTPCTATGVQLTA